MELDYKNFIRKRITQLRMNKGLSEYKLSTVLGFHGSYIQKIVNGETMPSMDGFLRICDYFDITPIEFFDVNNLSNEYKEAIEKLKQLPSNDVKLLIPYIDRLLK